ESLTKTVIADVYYPEGFLAKSGWQSFKQALELPIDDIFDIPLYKKSPFLLSAGLVTPSFGVDDMSLAVPKYKGLGEKSFDVYAKQWVCSFLDNHKRFLQTLEELESVFNATLLSHYADFGIQSLGLAKMIVVSVSDIIQLYKTMVRSMENQPSLAAVCTAFLENSDRISHLFSKFFLECTHSGTTLQKYENSRAFKAALDKLHARSASGDKFASLRGKISGRTMAYPGLFQDISESIPPDHELYVLVCQTYLKAKEVAHLNNASGSAIDSKAIIFALGNMLRGGTFANSQSVYLSELKV
ncbi:hypothetical protein HDU91_003950, partial [Kappamyces sp. JEL0680]